ncbi:MAG: hypothetical protein ING65_12850 [Rhodocyclaceae bacterium]|nr:hypothetical protein [Rhodocyclaceae bacterium]
MAAKIVSVFNHKGGVGMTLISMLVAGELALLTLRKFHRERLATTYALMSAVEKYESNINDK